MREKETSEAPHKLVCVRYRIERPMIVDVLLQGSADPHTDHDIVGVHFCGIETGGFEYGIGSTSLRVNEIVESRTFEKIEEEV